MKLLEKDIEHSILEWLNCQGIFAFKVKDQVRVGRDGKPRRPSKYMIRGVSDIIVCHKCKTLFVEVKITKGKQSDYQIEFERLIKKSGGSYHVVRNIEDMEKVLIEECNTVSN